MGLSLFPNRSLQADYQLLAGCYFIVSSNPPCTGILLCLPEWHFCRLPVKFEVEAVVHMAEGMLWLGSSAADIQMSISSESLMPSVLLFLHCLCELAQRTVPIPCTEGM